MLYDFGGFQLDDERSTPSGGEGRVHVEPQLVDVLHYLPTRQEPRGRSTRGVTGPRGSG